VLRVLLLIKGLKRGGAEQLLLHAAPHRDRSRFTYEVAYLLPDHDALVADLEAAGLPVHCLDGARGAGWVGRLVALARAREIDVVHVHSPYAAVGARLGLAGAGRRRPALVYTEHSLWGLYHPATYWGNAITYPLNRHVFAVSEQVRGSIRYPRPLGALAMPPVETLYHGLDLGAVAAAAAPDGVRAELGVPDGVPLVGTVANFRPEKGHRHLLQAAVTVRRALPETRFVLVGTGPLESRMRVVAEELGLGDSVVFTGYRPDAPRLMAAFDLFVLASTFEGFSIALAEAMALGRPSVVTRVGGLPEAVGDGQEGLIVSPADPRALADAMLDLLADPAARRRLGAAARRRAAAFDIRTAVCRMETVYQEVSA
jgi:glycosyltransferase involved in cell wall biosynthesis